MNRVIDRVNALSEDLLLHYATPNKNIIAEVMTLDASMLGEVPNERLSQYIYAMGQYLVTLQYHENLKSVEYSIHNKAFEHHLNVEKFSREDVKGKTEKERRAWLLINVPGLKDMSDDVLAAEAEKGIISGMVKSVEALLNAMKKELSHRLNYE